MTNNENNSFDDAAQDAGADENLTADVAADEAATAEIAIGATDITSTEVDFAAVEADDPVRVGIEHNRRPSWLAPAAVAAILVPVLALGGGVAAAAHKTIEFDYDGDVQQVTTWSGSVGGFLEKEGITLAEHDEVAPGLDAELTEGGVVVVRVAEQVELDVDGETVTIWTTADSAHELMTSLADSGRSGSIVASSRSISDGRNPLDLPLVENGAVLLQVDGGEETRVFTSATSVKEALDAFGVELGETDEVTLGAGPAGEVLLRVTRIVYSERTETEEVAFETETRSNDSMYKDQSKVVQAGVVGERTFTFKVTTVDGEEVEATEVSNEITTAPVTKIVENGTKARPVVAASTSSSGAAVGGDVWARLAQCESGGNPSAVSASGTYHGLYQFSVATWRSVGGSGLPSQASAAEQTQRAQVLQARAGWGQWPACSAKLGLR